MSVNHRDTVRLNWRSAWRNTLPWMCGRSIQAPLTSTSSMPDAEADIDHQTFHHERRNVISRVCSFMIRDWRDEHRRLKPNKFKSSSDSEQQPVSW